VFEEIKSLRPHFHSLREIQNNVSLDIKVPLSWKYEDIVKPYRTVTLKVQDKNDKFNLVSFISQATQEGYDVVFACASEITNHNKECPKLQFRCLWCQSTINLSESRKHQEECPKRLTDCSKCRLGYPHHLKASHDEYYCNMISSQFESYQKLFNKK
jgi:hypothetical protein